MVVVFFNFASIYRIDEPSAVNFNNNFKPSMDGNEHFYRMPPMPMGQTNSIGNMMMNMPPRGPPRFSSNNNNQGENNCHRLMAPNKIQMILINNKLLCVLGNQMHRMNFGPPPMSQMSQGQRPRYMNR